MFNKRSLFSLLVVVILCIASSFIFKYPFILFVSAIIGFSVPSLMDKYLNKHYQKWGW